MSVEREVQELKTRLDALESVNRKGLQAREVRRSLVSAVESAKEQLQRLDVLMQDIEQYRARLATLEADLTVKSE